MEQRDSIISEGFALALLSNGPRTQRSIDASLVLVGAASILAVSLLPGWTTEFNNCK